MFVKTTVVAAISAPLIVVAAIVTVAGAIAVAPDAGVNAPLCATVPAALQLPLTPSASPRHNAPMRG